MSTTSKTTYLLSPLERVVFYALIPCVGASAYGCKDDRSSADLEERLAASIRECSSALGDPWDRLVLQKLRAKSASLESLSTPDLVYAAFNVTPLGDQLLFGQWIEAQPSVDSVQLTCLRTGQSVSVAIDDDVIGKEGAKRAQGGVVFFFGYRPDCAKDQEWASEMLDVLNGGPCEVALLREGRIVSNTVKVRMCGNAASQRAE